MQKILAAVLRRNRHVICRDMLGGDTSMAGRQKAIDEKLFTTVRLGKLISAATLLGQLRY